MPADQAERVQHGNRQDEPVSDESREKAASARAVVAARAAGLDQTGVVSAAPKLLSEHIHGLQQHPAVAPYFNEGWVVSLVDLDRVCAVQPNVFVDHAVERVRNVDPDDITSIGAVSLPLPAITELPAQFDESKNVWLFSAPNPNLRLTGHFAAEIQPQIAHGETVRETANMISFMTEAIGIRDDMYLGEGNTYMREVGQAVQEGFEKGVLHQRPSVINLQCDVDHPTQAMADLMQVKNHFGSLEKLRGQEDRHDLGLLAQLRQAAFRAAGDHRPDDALRDASVAGLPRGLRADPRGG